MLPLDDIGDETVSVTLIDANHCPGSVMFLFEGYFGTILYTGDFRFSPYMLDNPPLKNKMTIDVLYLDNTNCDPDQELPSRQEATEQIKNIINKHPGHDIVIGLYSIGKEELLVELAKTFQSWIVVSRQRLELLQLLELEDVFTAEEGAGRIRVVDQSEVKFSNMVKWNQIYPTVAILPTSRKVKIWHTNIHVVPYSDHSSFKELVEFVSRIDPCSIIPVVKKHVCETLFQQYLSSKNDKKHVVKIPESVKAYMIKQKSFGTLETKHIYKASLPRRGPRGVEFESPEKSVHGADDFSDLKDKQKSTPNSQEKNSHFYWSHDIADLTLDIAEKIGQTSLDESMVLVSNRDKTSSKSSSLIEEMPSAISFSPKEGNATIMSNTSMLFPVATSNVSPDICTNQKKVSHYFHTKRTDSERPTLTSRLSMLPRKKWSDFGPQTFDYRVERYFQALHSIKP
ncbi:5' exonuclease Apollo isoform X2 [Bombina bombina]|nr:5' exonuclease Apollo isoform X2 [Bombina bombina]